MQAMFRQLLNIYSQNNGKAYPDHMYGVLLIRVQQQVEDIRALEYNYKSPIREIWLYNGRSKVALESLKDQTRRNCDLYMQGWKRANGETGEGEVLKKTDGIDAEIKYTTY